MVNNLGHALVRADLGGVPTIRHTVPGSPRRADAEGFIRDVFARHFGARVPSFAPNLMVREADGQILAAAGWRCAGDGQLYLERYLDQPIKVAMKPLAGFTPRHEHLVEVGNLVCCCIVNATTACRKTRSNSRQGTALRANGGFVLASETIPPAAQPIILQKLALTAYQALRAGASVLEADRHGEKVLRLLDGTFLKHFRRKRLLSSAAYYPYAARFADNALALTARDIPCPRVIGVFRVAELKRDIVHYHPLAGVTLREKLHASMSAAEAADLRRDFNLFVRRLHDLGLYFRSLHLGNVVLTPDGRLGLIDISDLRVHRRPLGRFWRARNLHRMQGIESERDWLDTAIILAP